MQGSDKIIHTEELSVFRKLVDRLDDQVKLDDMINTLASIYDLDLEKTIVADDLKRMYQDFVVDEAREITIPLAEGYAGKVFAQLMPNVTVRQALLSIGRMYLETTKPLVPILASFWRSIMDRCEEDGIQKIIFAANDANPIYIVAKKLRRSDFRLELVDLGRSLFHIRDEISMVVNHKEQDSEKSEFGFAPNHAQAKLQKRFLEILKGDDDRIAFVDAECYGSIVRILLKLNWNLSVFLLTSNNPFLHGYLNKLVDAININKTRVPKDMPWLVGDTIESFPRPYKVTGIDLENDKFVIKGYRESWFFGACGLMSYWCFNEHSSTIQSHDIDPFDSLLKVHELSRSSNLPYLLPSPMPEWEKAGEFVRLWLNEGFGFVHPQSEVIANGLLKYG
jgi:hypothetical protein